MSVLSREELLRLAGNLRVSKVELPGIGHVFVRGLTLAERDKFEASLLRGGELEIRDVRATLLTLSICDEHGRRLFADHEAEIVGQLPAELLQPAFEEAMRLSALTGEAVAELKKSAEGGPDAGFSV